AQHDRDPMFSCRAAPDCRLLNSFRRIFEYWQSVFGGSQNGRATRRAEDDRGLIALHINDRFQRATVRSVLANQFNNPITDAHQTGGRTYRAFVVNCSEIERLDRKSVV